MWCSTSQPWSSVRHCCSSDLDQTSCLLGWRYDQIFAHRRGFLDVHGDGDDSRTRRGATQSKARLRRVSHRPGQAYSRAKQVIVVAAGNWKAVWNFTQKILVSRSIAAYSIAEPAAQANPNMQPIINGIAPGIFLRRELKMAIPSIKKTTRIDGQMAGM